MFAKTNIVITIVISVANLLPLLAQPVYLSSASQVGNASQATVPKPAGTAGGDLLVVGLMIEKGSDETVTPPSGWTLIRRTNNITQIGMATYFKIMGTNEPVSYAFGLANGSKWAIGCSRISNVNPSNPIFISNGTDGKGKNVTAPTISTAGGKKLVICFYTNNKKSTFTPDPSTMERYDHPYDLGGTPANMMATFEQLSDGNTGNKIAISASSGEWVGMQIAINEASPLPIELTYFYAQPTTDFDVNIEWATATELNNAFFTIERSADTKNWEGIRDMDGAHHSTNTIYYKYTDTKPLNGTSYYRLKQTDFDGMYTYSEIRSVYIDASASSTLLIYPNPVIEQICLSGNVGELSDIQLFNAMGQNMSHQIRISPGIKSQFILDLSRIPAGEYIIKTKWHTNKILKF